MHKVVLLNGFGRVGRVLHSNPRPYIYTESYTFAGCKPIMDKEFSELIKFIEKNDDDHLTLVKAYKTAQRKYYPEKDVFLKLNKRR